MIIRRILHIIRLLHLYSSFPSLFMRVCAFVGLFKPHMTNHNSDTGYLTDGYVEWRILLVV